MGDKRPSVRTLPSGEKVVHHPDGTQRLIPSGRAKATLAATAAQADADAAALESRMLDAVAAKREALASGDAVPGDKRPV